MGKNITVKNVDEEVYKRFKAVAALKGVTLGEALNEAMKLWIKVSLSSDKYLQIEVEAEKNREVFRKMEKDLLSKFSGKFVAIAGGKLIGLFDNREEAIRAISNLNVKHAIVTKIEKKKPRVIEFGMSVLEERI